MRVEQYKTAQEARDAIKERRELQNQMVGQLYPGIIEDEIVQINSQLWKLEREEREAKEFAKAREGMFTLDQVIDIVHEFGQQMICHHCDEPYVFNKDNLEHHLQDWIEEYLKKIGTP